MTSPITRAQRPHSPPGGNMDDTAPQQPQDHCPICVAPLRADGSHVAPSGARIPPAIVTAPGAIHAALPAGAL
jgi:hypothetical protein